MSKHKITYREFKYSDDFSIPVPVLEKKIENFGGYINSLLPQIKNKSQKRALENNHYFLSGFEDVLSGKSQYEERSNEGVLIKIKSDITEVTDNFNLNLYYSEIETKELYELCLEWIKILDDYYTKYPDRIPSY